MINVKGDSYIRAISKAYNLFPKCTQIGKSNEYLVASTRDSFTSYIVTLNGKNLEGAHCTCPAGEHEEIKTCVHRARAYLAYNFKQVCNWCCRPASDFQNLVRANNYYEHPSCSPTPELYQQVTEVSFPDEDVEEEILENFNPIDGYNAINRTA